MVEAMLGPGYQDFKAASWRCQSDEKKAAEDFKKLPERIQRMWAARAETEDIQKLETDKRFDEKCRASLTELVVQFYEWQKAVDAAKEALENASYKAKRSNFTESRSKFIESEAKSKTSKQTQTVKQLREFKQHLKVRS